MIRNPYPNLTPNIFLRPCGSAVTPLGRRVGRAVAPRRPPNATERLYGGTAIGRIRTILPVVQFVTRPKNETNLRFVPFSTSLYQALTPIQRSLVSFPVTSPSLDESVRFIPFGRFRFA